MDFNGKAVLVTGATSGIGLATSEAFCLRGARVFINGKDEVSVGRIVESFQLKGYTVEPLAFDVSDNDEVYRGFKTLKKLSGRLDVLVNNAGVLDDALIGMVSRKMIESTFSVNAYSALFTSQYASRMMVRQGGGAIINISSIIGMTGNAGQAVYAGSKAAVIGITKSLAKELADQNITVNSVLPGFIDTKMARSLSKEHFSQRIDSIAMKRIGKAKDVAELVVFLGSPQASYITGQAIGVDGGMLI